ncbi:hypothetical protein SDC9_172679 [bioreactor metagenome]|uniref:Uncharacterized protein n=1 Tax=bioreactor metagenome TaxID=1076179 RepID=A0A645GH15_9ZZZZ
MFRASGGSPRQVTAILNDGIQHLPIVRGNVLHVTHVFVTPFNLEGTHTGVDQRAKVSGLIVIFHRQQVFFIGHHASLIVFQGIRQTASLGTVATVSTASGLRM